MRARGKLTLVAMAMGAAALGGGLWWAVLPRRPGAENDRRYEAPSPAPQPAGLQLAASRPAAQQAPPDSPTKPVADAIRIERVGNYIPPVGIPAPSFGIDESHWMYADSQYTYNYGNGLEAYRMSANGPYTHYVDSSASNSTDSGNPFGTPEAPRKTIPTYLPAGSVVEVHGSYSSNWSIEADGTAAAPVFIRGASATDRPTLAASASVRGQYVIWENILQTGQRSFSVSNYNNRVPHHVAIRNCELAGNGTLGSSMAMMVYGNEGLDVNNVVLYNNSIYNQGDSEADTSRDRHGIAVTRHTNNIWVLNNNVHHSQADAIQVNGWVNETTHHIYIGGNVFHDDGENAIDIKEASDVIVSQNIMYGYEHSEGAAMNAHRDDGQVIGPQNVWVLFNYIYDSYDGIVSMGVKGDFYAIGNVMHDMGDSGLKSWSAGTRHLINNTIYNTRRAIAHAGGAEAVIVNNIIYDASSLHIYLPDAENVSTMRNNLLYQDGGSVAIRWGSGSYSSVLSFQSSTGQGQGSIEADPEFVSISGDDYRLQSGSPAVDAGANVQSYAATFAALYGLDINVDYAGAPLPQGPATDIGAIELAGDGKDHGQQESR